MEQFSVPVGLSLYRGQADQGIGEPGGGIRRGEQYIAADPVLANDAELLRVVRDWLTLDSTPADHGRADGHLAGWATFPLGPYTFVVRLGSAGKYSGRDAYFTHARVWRTSTLPADIDPGLYMGVDRCFAESAPEIGDFSHAELPAPSPAPLEPVLARKDLCISLIAHLFHALQTGVPLIVAVPIAAFAATSTWPRQIAFARGVLPARLRRRCRIRIFSRSPQRLLDRGTGPGGADLLLIPNDLTVRDALAAAGQTALLLDEYGERQQGTAPSDEMLAYAANLLDSVQRFPERLTAFTNRFDAFWPDDGKPPTTVQTDWVALTYNLSVAMAGSEAQRGSLFANYLLGLARSRPVPWSALVRPEEWALFPREHLIRFILRADDDLSPGERQLQAHLAGVLQQHGENLDAGLSPWWNPADPAKRRRLLELCQSDPPMLSPAASAALTMNLAIDELAASGAPITGALRAEYRQGQLGRRERDAERLLALLDHPGLIELLDEAGRDGVLPAPWQDGDLAAIPGPQTIALARHLLRGSDAPSPSPLLPRLLARLRQEPNGLEAIADDLRNAVYRLDVPRYPERYLDLADALLDARPGSAEELRGRLWDATNRLATLEDPKPFLMQIVSGRWSTLGSKHLLDPDGSLIVAATDASAVVLLECPTIVERLRRADLMALGALLPAAAHRAVGAYLARVDALMEAEPKATTARLIEFGAWLAWRRHAAHRLGADARHRCAMEWLTSPVLAAFRTASAAELPPQWGTPGETNERRPDIDPTMETWAQVMDDLRPLGYGDIDRLTKGETHCPWLHPFQVHQVGTVAAKCADLDALALLVQRASEQLHAAQARLAEWSWQRAPQQAAWPGNPLGWLLRDPQAAPLDLATANRLVEATAAYRESAHQARVAAVIAALETEPRSAIAAIDAAGGWSHPEFLHGVRRLLLRAAPQGDVLKQIERGLAQGGEAAGRAPATTPAQSGEADEAARAFLRAGYPAIAELLSPGLSAREAERRWPEDVIDALLDPATGDAALDALRRRVRHAVQHCRASDHPLTMVLARINRLPDQRRAELRKCGWQHLRAVVERDDGFLSWAELPNGALVLPLFHLAISLLPEGAGQAGQLARYLMSAPVSGRLRKHRRWWLALLASVLDQTDPGYAERGEATGLRLRPSAQTRSAAIGLIYAGSADLGDDEIQKFDAAWQRLNMAGLWSPYGANEQ
jgi:hypothetical protein